MRHIEISEEVMAIIDRIKNGDRVSLMMLFYDLEQPVITLGMGDKIVEKFKELASDGHPEIISDLGLMNSEKGNYDKGYEYLIVGAENGCATAQFGLYQMYYNGVGVETDEPLSIKYLKEAANSTCEC